MDAVSRLDALLNTWLLEAHSPLEQYAVWSIKVRAKRLLAIASHPERRAAQMLRVLTVSSQKSLAA